MTTHSLLQGLGGCEFTHLSLDACFWDPRQGLPTINPKPMFVIKHEFSSRNTFFFPGKLTNSLLQVSVDNTPC